MQEQYDLIKSEYSDSIVLFRLGDFYEAFNDDAVEISKVLGITLTGRGKDENRKAMAGIPHHALPNYLPKLVAAGLKVAVADQTEEAVPGKLVERKVTKIITPGTVTDENSLDSTKNNYISSIYIEEIGNRNNLSQKYNFVYCDLTTGELKAFQTDNALILKNELNKVNPAELVSPISQINRTSIIYKKRIEPVDDSEFNSEKNYEFLKKQFKTENLKGFGIDTEKGIISAAGALLKYLEKCQKTPLKHISGIKIYSYSDYMHLDFETIRNLELLYPISGNDLSSTVYETINECQSSMGKRKLRQFLLRPLTNQFMLQERLDAVQYFFDESILTGELRSLLKNTADFERITGRIGLASANPKDIAALKNSIIQSLEIIKKINQSNERLPTRIAFLIKSINYEQLSNAVKIIADSILDDPSAAVNEGGIIKDGFDSQVDEFRNIRNNIRQILQEMQTREVQATGISSLKISYNKVFGYYIEITRSHLEKVPDRYIRKQTLANAERYITQELKELEEKILSSEEKLIQRERELFFQIQSELVNYLQEILQLADEIAEIDVLTNFAHIARQYKYSKPEISSEDVFEIQNGRHIVVERLVGEFTPNDSHFSEKSQVHILTGPNMSGKSTYIRQVALLGLIAQIGSFVPAEKMKFSILDRIFTRVGASDNLARGESTFMVEMTETANILNNATDKSLVILDEVGRGTSTYDGVAIAWSIVEFIATKLKSKTLFATHYHELIELETTFENIKNFNVKVENDADDIIFLHKIVDGGTDQSYGVHVAKIAGVPDEVTKRANEILLKFEKENQIGEKKNEIGNKRHEIGDMKYDNVGMKQENQTTSNQQSVIRTPRKPRIIHPAQMGLI